MFKPFSKKAEPVAKQEPVLPETTDAVNDNPSAEDLPEKKKGLGGLFGKKKEKERIAPTLSEDSPWQPARKDIPVTSEEVAKEDKQPEPEQPKAEEPIKETAPEEKTAEEQTAQPEAEKTEEPSQAEKKAEDFTFFGDEKPEAEEPEAEKPAAETEPEAETPVAEEQQEQPVEQDEKVKKGFLGLFSGKKKQDPADIQGSLESDEAQASEATEEKTKKSFFGFGKKAKAADETPASEDAAAIEPAAGADKADKKGFFGLFGGKKKQDAEKDVPAEAVTPEKIPGSEEDVAKIVDGESKDVAAATDDSATPPVTPPANDDTPATPKTLKISKKMVLSAAFNMAAGAAVTAAAKTAVVATMTLATAPAVATLILSSAAVGIAAAGYGYWREQSAAKKAGLDAPKFLTRKTFNTFVFSGGFALAGGGLFLALEEPVKNVFAGLFTVKDAVADVPPVVAPTPEPVVVATPPVVAAPIELPPAPVIECITAMERVRDIVAQTPGVSAEVADALKRAGSESARVAAQGAKDLGYFLFNGLGGIAENKAVAVELFQQAADAGNLQAKTDLLYVQYHGLTDGIAADKPTALAHMATVDNPRAESLAQAWSTATTPAANAAPFDAKSIVKAVPGICLK